MIDPTIARNVVEGQLASATPPLSPANARVDAHGMFEVSA
jgi:hypothetical protein